MSNRRYTTTSRKLGKRVSSVDQTKVDGDEDIENTFQYEFEHAKKSVYSSLLSLPYNLIWYYFIMVMSCTVVVTIIYNGMRMTHSHAINIKAIKIITDVLYVIDTALVVCGKCYSDRHVISHLRGNRPNWLILTDMLSVVPTFGYRIILTFIAANYWNIFDFLKLGRVYYHFYYHMSLVGNRRKALIIGQYALKEITACIVVFAIMLYLFCHGAHAIINHCDKDMYLLLLYAAVSKMTFKGFLKLMHVEIQKYYLTFIIIFAYYLLFSSTLGHYIIYVINVNKNKFRFINKMNSAVLEIKLLNVSRFVLRDCVDFYNMFWQQLNSAFDHVIVSKILPQSLQKGLALDINYKALRHCQLFRKVDSSVLRDVSVVMKQEYLLENQYVYYKNCIKNKMVYVESGIVHILAPEDEETPIISFSSGTCLGEASLIIPYKASTIVQCKSFCKVHVLYQPDFIRVMKNYPEVLKEMRNSILERRRKAEEYRNIALLNNSLKGIKGDHENFTIMWIKTTLHQLMMKDGETSTKHEHQNIFLRDDLNKELFTKMLFLPNYLDLLAITERIQLNTDSLFLKFTFPYIFRPSSLLLQGWKYFIYVLIVFTGILVPYFAFVESNTANWYSIYIYIVTAIWWIDIYIEVSTALNDDDDSSITIKGIFMRKIKFLSFCLDILSGFPCEMFTCILFNPVSNQKVANLYLNRILKMYNLTIMFRNMENKVNANLVLLCYVKYFFLYFYLIYIGACFLSSQNCFDSVCVIYPSDFKLNLFYLHVFSSTSMLTGVGIPGPIDNAPVYFIAYTCILLVSIIYSIFFFGSIIAVYTLQKITSFTLQDLLTDILKAVKIRGLDAYNTYRICNYVETHWTYNKAMRIMYYHTLLSDIPVHTTKSARREAYAELLKATNIFGDLPDSIICDLCAVAYIVVLPPNEVISYNGEICNEFYFILSGYCESVLSATCKSETVFGPGDLISVAETFMKVPVVNTITTKTHIQMMAFDYGRMRNLFNTCPEIVECFDEVANDHELFLSLKLLSREHKRCDVISKIKKATRRPQSFHIFGYNMPADSLIEYEYFNPFDRLYNYGFVRYFLLRLTINPEGNFMLIWELVRCVCAFVSSILFVVSPINTCTSCLWYYIMICLDITAFVDVYVRLHLCFYNESNVLVTHPLETAKNYLKNGFLIDVLAVLPLNYMFARRTAKDNKIVTALQCNRILQVYRIFGFAKYKSSFTRYHFISVIEYVVQLLILVNMVGSVIVNIECSFSEQIKYAEFGDVTNGIECSSDSWVSRTTLTKPLSPIRVYLYGVYIATTFFIGSGLQGFSIQTYRMTFITMILSMLGVITTAYIHARVVAMHLSSNRILSYYQDGLIALRKFMSVHKVKVSAQNEMIRHLELKSRREMGNEVQLLNKFHHVIQEDVLYELYKDVLGKYSVFTVDAEMFFRKMLVKTINKFVVCGGYVARVNDICKFVNILYSGRVDVIAPDGTLLDTLNVGSMFGNLDECEMTRQTVSLRANGHVQLLEILSTDFHSIIAHFPQLKSRFRNLTLMHTDYISGRNFVEVSEEDSIQNIKYYQKFCRHHHVFNPFTTRMRIWKCFVLIYICYIATLMNIFQIAVHEFNFYFIIAQYVCDILYIVDFYVWYHTAYENESGVLVKDLNLVRKRIYKHKYTVWSRAISLIALDVFVWFIPMSLSMRQTMYIVLRINRLLRLVHVIVYCNLYKRRLNKNIYLIRFSQLSLWIIFSIHVYTCSLMYMCCAYKVNMIVNIECNVNMGFKGKLDFYMTALYVSVCCLTKNAQSEFYPDSTALVIFIIIMMFSNELLSSYFCAQICATLMLMNNLQSKYTQTIEQFRHYMEREDVSKPLFERIWKYMRLYWIHHKGYSFPALLEEAPLYLREKILTESVGHHINYHYIFSACHKDFLRQVITRLKSEMFFVGDYIAYRGAINDTMYFIHVGEIIVLSENMKNIVCKLGSGQSFGILQGLYPLTPHRYTFLASKFSVVLTLHKNDWIYLLGFYPASKSSINAVARNYVGF